LLRAAHNSTDDADVFAADAFTVTMRRYYLRATPFFRTRAADAAAL